VEILVLLSWPPGAEW